LVKLDIFINNEKVEALTWVVHRDKAYYLGRDVVEKLKTLIPKQLFAIPLQAGLGTKMIAQSPGGMIIKLLVLQKLLGELQVLYVVQIVPLV
jgi:translation elongation factor EF-4